MLIRDPNEVERWVSIDGAIRNRKKLLADIATTGAVARGHFLLSSGDLHSALFFRFRHLAQDKDALARAAGELFEASGLDRRSSERIVLAPESAGAMLADQLAHELGAALALVRLDDGRRPTKSLLGKTPLSGRPVLIVNDVTTSQSALDTLVSAAREHDGQVEAVLVYGALKRDDFNRWLVKNALIGTSLVSLPFERFAASHCPGCREGLPLLPAAELN